MRLKRPIRSSRRRALVVGALTARSQWRRECAAVRNAYRRWVRASAAEKPSAFDEYNAALDREERAAIRYARSVGRAGRVAEPGFPHQLAEIR